MITPSKQFDDFIHSEISDFSHDYRQLEFQTSKLKDRIRELEDQVLDLQRQLADRDLKITEFSDRMNQVRKMKSPEGADEGSQQFLEKKLEAYEKIVPPSGSYQLQILNNVLTFCMDQSHTDLSKSIDKMQTKVTKLATNLKNCRDQLKEAKNRHFLQTNLPYEKLTEALDGFRKSLGLKPKIEDLIYLDGHELKISIPLDGFKKCLFFMLQAEEIVTRFNKGLLNKYLGLKESVKNFHGLIESLPRKFPISEDITALYGKIIKGLNEFNKQLQENSLELMKPENYQELNTTQNTLVKATQLHDSMIAKGDEIQEMVNGLYPRTQEFIRGIFIKTKEVRGAEIKANA